MYKFFLPLFFLSFWPKATLAQGDAPIIDVHLHAWERWPSGGDTSWYPKALYRPLNSTALMEETVKQMDKYHVVKAVVSGDSGTMMRWQLFANNRFLPGYEPYIPPKGLAVEQLREEIKSGKIKVLGEIVTQYEGINPSDSNMEVIYKLAEEFDIPVGIHVGLGPPGIAYKMKYRSRLSSPLLLEEVLVRHPKLRLYVMHAGWPMLDDMVAMLYAFPNLYVDISVIDWYIPKAEFYSYLKRLIDAGFSKRIMYGSDQMEWPESIGVSIHTIQEASFLNREQKRDIFYNNAVRFFKFSDGR